MNGSTLKPQILDKPHRAESDPDNRWQPHSTVTNLKQEEFVNFIVEKEKVKVFFYNARKPTNQTLGNPSPIEIKTNSFATCRVMLPVDYKNEDEDTFYAVLYD